MELSMNDKAKGSRPDNQGEGNRDAARHYNDAQKKFVDSGKVDEAAREAREAIDSPEAEDLKQAEREGLSRGRH